MHFIKSEIVGYRNVLLKPYINALIPGVLKISSMHSSF